MATSDTYAVGMQGEADAQPVDDSDDLDGCDVDLTEDITSDDDLELTVLSPDGDEQRLIEYQALFKEDHS